MEKGYLTVPETAIYLTLAEGTIYNWIHHKKIKYLKIGNSVRISKKYLDDLINKNTINPVRNFALK